MEKDSTVKKTVDKKKVEAKKPYSQGFLLILATIFGFVGGFAGSEIGRISTEGVDQTVTREIITGEENLINTIASDVSKSVVSINVTGVSYTQDFFGFSSPRSQQSAGTGFIIDKDGLVLTNRHVVDEGTTAVEVVFDDGRTAEADVVGRTSSSDPLDIAFLQIKDADDYDLVPVALGDSDELKVGDKVVAIGNALGEFQNTVTSGIISGFGRDIEAYSSNGTESLQNLIQTDAAINSGNSGGPLVNSSSEVIGVNVATAGAENISFAIPINDVKGLIDTVLETGKLERVYLGVRYISLNEGIADELELDVSEGAYIPEGSEFSPSIIPESPADEAGIEEEDIITEIAGEKITEDRSLVSILAQKRVGDEVELKVNRGGEDVTLRATLQAAPEQ